MTQDRLITVAIHTYDKALELRAMLEAEGIQVTFQNVNLQTPVVSSGVRVRINESNLPLALRIIENPHVFSSADKPNQEDSHYILVPVDFSNYSFRAACEASLMANELHANVCLLYSYLDPNEAGTMQLTANLTYDSADNTLRTQLDTEARLRMSEFTDKLTSMMKTGELPPVLISTKIVEGVPEDAIVNYSRVNPPLLVIMGTRGATRKEKELIGSVTAEVLDACQSSILAIPEGAKGQSNSKNILFFSNLDQEDILAIDTLHRIYPSRSFHVTLLHVPGKKRLLFERPTEKDLKSLLQYCTEHCHNYTFGARSIPNNSEIEDIKKIFDENEADLIVIPNKKKNIFTRLISPSLAHKVLFHSPTPVLAIPV